MSQMTVFPGPERRRRWTPEERRSILAEAFSAGACVADVARCRDVSTSLIYTWRRNLYKTRVVAAPNDGTEFAEAVMVEDPPTMAVGASPAIVVDLTPGTRVSIFPSASSAIVSAALAALR